MDTNTVIMALVIVFAVVTIIGFIRYRNQGTAFFKWLGIELKVSGENTVNEQKAGINAEDVLIREGGLRAEETDGKGINAERIDSRDDVVLSSSGKQANYRQPASMSPSFINAQALSAGGDITIFLQQLGLENYHFSQFAQTQFEAYSNTWKKLQALRVAGDKLWEEASSDNLYEFGKQLRQVKILTLEDDIYFEDAHRDALNSVLSDFGKFYFGKQRLINIRSKFELDRFMQDKYEQEEVKQQIRQNRYAKKQYERLLDEIRIAFRNKLTKL